MMSPTVRTLLSSRRSFNEGKSSSVSSVLEINTYTVHNFYNRKIANQENGPLHPSRKHAPHN
jgi:hypothetical protein